MMLGESDNGGEKDHKVDEGQDKPVTDITSSWKYRNASKDEEYEVICKMETGRSKRT